MAFPLILIDSAGGSDSLTSGAGPGDGTTTGSALTGTSASTDATGLIVTLDGSPDLTNVATDGSHAIYLADSTAGRRNFGKITAKDNTAKTVTVGTAFGVSLTGLSWAIGGKRASLGSTSSKKLVNNNGAAGDALGGWTVRFVSGNTEANSATLTVLAAGDATNGRLTIEGDPAAATTPILTFSNNSNGLTINASYVEARNLEFQNTNASKTSSVAVSIGSNAAYCRVSGLKIADPTNNFGKGITISSASAVVENSMIKGCASDGIGTSSTAPFTVQDCVIKGNGGNGITGPTGGTLGPNTLLGCVIAGNAGDGCVIASSGTYASAWYNPTILGNTFDANGGSGLTVNEPSTGRDIGGMILRNNIFSNHPSYGVNLPGSGITDAALVAAIFRGRGNSFYNNTLGDCNPSLASLPTAFKDSTTGVNPSYTNAAGGDYSIGTGLKAKGYPVGGSEPIGKYSATYSYPDPGAAQRQEPAGTNVTYWIEG